MLGSVADVKQKGPLCDRKGERANVAPLTQEALAPDEFRERLRFRLTPNGCLVVCLPNVNHGALRLSLLEGRFEYQSEGLLDRTHLRFFTLSSLLDTFGAADYAVSELQRIRCGFFATKIRLDPARSS
jgi:hypothetical protein